MKVRVLMIALVCMGCIDVQSSPAPAPDPSSEHSVGGKTAPEIFARDPYLLALARAACDGDAETVARLVQTGADPDAQGLDGVTPLIWAQSCDSLIGMEALLENGADPNRQFYGSSAVWIAANDYSVEQLELLVRHGGDVDFVADDGKTVLIAALRRGHRGNGWGNFEFLLDAGASVNLVSPAAWLSSRQVTVAEDAAYMDEYERVVQLLERGYNARLRNLARIIEGSIERQQPIPPGQIRWRARAQAILVERGVRFPIGPISD